MRALASIWAGLWPMNMLTRMPASRRGATLAASLGLEVHAGHGLTYDNVAPVAAIPELMELNIGHFLIGEAIYLGLGPAIEEMRRRMDEARSGARA